MSKTILTLTLTCAVVGASACNTPSRVHDHLGEAYREAIARSTDDPEGAAANADRAAPSGTDGMTAEQNVGRYRQGLQPASEPTLPLPMIVTDGNSD